MKEHAEPYDISSHVAIIAVVPVQCRHGLGMCRPWPATDQMDSVTAMHIYLLCHRRNHAAFNRGEEDVVVVLRRSWLQNHLQALRGLCEREASMTHPLRKNPCRNCISSVEQACWKATFRQALTVAHCQQTKSWELRARMNLSRL